MKAYDIYLKFPNTLYDYNFFVSDLSKFILEDNKVIAFFKDYDSIDYYVNPFEYIFDNLEDSLIAKLDKLFAPNRKFDERNFYAQIASVSDSVFLDTILRYLDYSNELIFKIPIIFKDDDKNNLRTLLTEIRLAKKEISTLILDKDSLTYKVKQWSSPLTIDPSNPNFIQLPLIKKVEYFDPTIYEVIIKNPTLLKTMDWRLFEEMLADILKKFKYEVELTKATKDGGIDIIAIKDDENFGKHKYLLQAKRHSHAVQVSPVRELLFLHNEYKATKSCLATTDKFTKGAWQLAEQHQWELELKDFNGIMNWISRVAKMRN